MILHKITPILVILLLTGTARTQDQVLMEDKMNGRYANISTTNFDLRFIQVEPDGIRTENMNGPDRLYRIIERDGNIIMTQCEDQILFFELGRDKIVFYQRVQLPSTTIAGYRKSKRWAKNTYKKVDSEVTN